MLTKKHFIAIATILRRGEANSYMVDAMADMLAAENPRFDKQKFITAVALPTPAPNWMQHRLPVQHLADIK
jgi:hypothetical protein|tara:strand:+ start:3420 stop:3632 length:213 start_codon:yes stop_codon:yes gene_type:complete